MRLKGERDKPWRVSATRNNDGDVSTGEQQMGLGLDWDSPLGLADQLNLRANRDAVTDRWRHSDSQSLFYSLPWGWWTSPTATARATTARATRPAASPSSSMATAAAISSAPNACCTATV